MMEDQEIKLGVGPRTNYTEKRLQRMANIKARLLATVRLGRLQQALKLTPDGDTLAPSREYQQVVGDIIVEDPGETLNQDPPAPAA